MVYKYMRSKKTKDEANRLKIKDNLIYSVLIISFIVYFVALNIVISSFSSFIAQFNRYVRTVEEQKVNMCLK